MGSFDHWKTGGDNPGITDAQVETEAREADDEARREAEDEHDDDSTD